MRRLRPSLIRAVPFIASFLVALPFERETWAELPPLVFVDLASCGETVISNSLVIPVFRFDPRGDGEPADVDSPAPQTDPKTRAFRVDLATLPATPPESRGASSWLEDPVFARLDKRMGRLRPGHLLLSLAESLPNETTTYLLKRIASLARSVEPGVRVHLLLPPESSTKALAELARLGGLPYVDSLSPVSRGGFSVAEEFELLAQGWPVARLERAELGSNALDSFLAAAARDRQSILYDCSSNGVAAAIDPTGFDRMLHYAALLRRPLAPAAASEALQWLPASATSATPVATFLDPATLATWITLPSRSDRGALVVPGRSERTATLIDPVAQSERPLRRRIDGSFEINAAPHPRFLRFDRAGGDIASPEEASTVTAAAPGLTAAEIIAKHRARRAVVDRTRPSFVAENRTALRFRISGLSDSFEIEIRGPYFSRGETGAEWEWREFWVNGVKWRGEKAPEIPLVQPDRVATTPLAISFTEEYVYERDDDETVEGRRAFVLSFSPRAGSESKTLWEGRAFIDAESFDLLRTTAVQRNPGDEVLSNEETATFAIASDGLPFLASVRGQMTISTLGQVTLVERDTRLLEPRFDDASFEAARQASRASTAVMVRETEKGIRYLDSIPGEEAGKRQVREGRTTRQIFGLGGVFVDDSLDYPLPLLGVNYLDFDLFGKGVQTNVFFAGALITASLSDPSLGGSRFDLGADLFALAIESNEDAYENGEALEEQRVRTRPAAFGLHLGHPLGDFAKLTVRYSLVHTSFDRDDETADDFVIPASGFTHGASAELRLDRWGYSLALEGGRSWRNDWSFWGRPDGSDYDAESDEYDTWRISAAKEWDLGGFQRLRLFASRLGGRHLDRFSKYSFGFFGGTRVSGFKSGSIRTENVWIASASYGVSIAGLFRAELAIDHARATDRAAGYDDTPFTGAALSGNFNGPWSTLVRYSIGVPIDGPEGDVDGFVLSMMVLKLF